MNSIYITAFDKRDNRQYVKIFYEDSEHEYIPSYDKDGVCKPHFRKTIKNVEYDTDSDEFLYLEDDIRIGIRAKLGKVYISGEITRKS